MKTTNDDDDTLEAPRRKAGRPQKFTTQAILKWIRENPRKSLKEAAAAFQITYQAIYIRFQREGITARPEKKTAYAKICRSCFEAYRGTLNLNEFAAGLGIEAPVARRQIMEGVRLEWSKKRPPWAAMPRNPQEVKLHHAIADGTPLTRADLRQATASAGPFVDKFLEYVLEFSKQFQSFVQGGNDRATALALTHKHFSTGVSP